MAGSKRDGSDANKQADDNLPLVPVPPSRAVSADERTCFTRVVVGAMATIILLTAWGVVALSIYLIMHVARGYGLAESTAALIAAPAVAVPLWKTIAVLRHLSLESALLGHLWVLNGAAVWAIIALGGMWWASMLQSALEGDRTGLLIALLVAGFPPLFGLLVLLNWWLLNRRIR